MRLKLTLTVGFITATLGIVILLLELGFNGFRLERTAGLSLLFYARGKITPPADVVIVSMDKQSALRLNHNGDTQSWPRRLHARLIDRLVEQNVAAIVFDVFFFEAKSDQDAEFAQSLRQAQRVVLAQEFWRDRHGGLITEELVSPTPEIATASLALGPFPLPKYPNRVEQFWTFQDNSRPVPTLPLLALQISLQRTLSQQTLAVLFELTGLTAVDLNDSQSLARFMLQLYNQLRDKPAALGRILQALQQTDLTASEKNKLAALIRAYSTASRFLNHYGPARTIPAIPYSTLLQSTETVPDLNNKVVFVGGRDPFRGQPDRFYTVYSNENEVDISGVEIAATAFANLLTGTSLWQLSGWGQLALVSVFGGIVGALAVGLGVVQALTAVTAVALMYYLLSQWLFNEYYLWLPLMIPLLIQLPGALLLGLLAQYRLSKYAAENITVALRGYIPELVVQQLSERPDPLAPIVIYGTCLCSDIEGYTALSEKLEPKQLTELTNEYYRLIGEPVDRYHGTRLDIVGDGMTCVWPSTEANSKVRLNACLAALAMQQALTEFHQQNSDYELSTRIGLHAGPLAIGNMGGGGHYMYGVAGDVPNTASRIESLNKWLDTRLLAEQSVVFGLNDLLLRPVGRFQLKGKRSTNTVFEIISLYSESSSEQQDLARRFAEALMVYEARQWDAATEAFRALVNDYPDDGPSRFYLKHSQFCSPAVIKMNEK